jgi:hypothetical protein
VRFGDKDEKVFGKGLICEMASGCTSRDGSPDWELDALHTRWDVGYLHWDGVLEYAFGDEKRIRALQLRNNGRMGSMRV